MLSGGRRAQDRAFMTQPAMTASMVVVIVVIVVVVMIVARVVPVIMAGVVPAGTVGGKVDMATLMIIIMAPGPIGMPIAPVVPPREGRRRKRQRRQQRGAESGLHDSSVHFSPLFFCFAFTPFVNAFTLSTFPRIICALTHIAQEMLGRRASLLRPL